MLTICKPEQRDAMRQIILNLITHGGYDRAFGSDPTNMDTLLHGAYREIFPVIADSIIQIDPGAVEVRDSQGRHPADVAHRDYKSSTDYDVMAFIS